MLLATEEVCIFRNMFCEIKSIVFKIKILTCLLLCLSFGTVKNFLIEIKTNLIHTLILHPFLRSFLLYY